MSRCKNILEHYGSCHLYLKKKLIKYIIHLYAIFKKYCHCQLSCVLKFV